MLDDYLHKEGENLSRLIVDHIQIAAQWGVDVIIDKSVELYLSFSYFVIETLDSLLKLLDIECLLNMFKANLASV